jgi:hypothetical protein
VPTTNAETSFVVNFILAPLINNSSAEGNPIDPFLHDYRKKKWQGPEATRSAKRQMIRLDAAGV